MSLRLVRLLLVLLLVFGQVGGWLHALGHYADGPVAADLHGDGDAPDHESDDAPCLVCLGYAALAVALLSGGLILASGASSFRLSSFDRRHPRSGRHYARSARGPPLFS
jgi:hypothetical protein